MWKYPCDVLNGVKTRSKANNEPIVGYEEVDKYFATKWIYNVEIYLQKVYLFSTILLTSVVWNCRFYSCTIAVKKDLSITVKECYFR